MLGMARKTSYYKMRIGGRYSEGRKAATNLPTIKIPIWKMAPTQTTNFIPELDLNRHTNSDVDVTDKGLDIICQICQERRLTISALAEAYILNTEDLAGPEGPVDKLFDLYAHGFEQTAVLPCGHIFGHRCVREELLRQGGMTCPSCGFQMTYKDCGHAIAPAIIPISEIGSIRDTFPLTIPEGGSPSQCKECRWQAIQTKLRYALDSACVMCAQRAQAGVQPKNAQEHDAHRRQHIHHGIGDTLGGIMMLVQPDFVTRTTASSAQKAEDERDRREVSTALLKAMALTELEDTVWHDAATRQLAEDQARRHAAGVRAIEDYILGLLMDYEKNCRRMW
ncbi:hypothetical protein F4802DRAFT_342535 [Xylaria palmicola]|nr:hypothetical protein F4802DRAFT_342535 [Xylaria palmicola]